MLKKKDLALILILAVIAGALFLIAGSINKGKRPVGAVRIFVNGELFQEVSMDGEKDIVIAQEGGAENILRVTENGFYMLSSTCKNQLCVHQGEVTEENYAFRALGTHILCLPNRVDAELVLSADEKDPNAPDV